jgi:hypothetical protein
MIIWARARIGNHIMFFWHNLINIKQQFILNIDNQSEKTK